MKGVIFTELIEMMEDLMGLDVTNKVIEDARLDNEGAYTAIGTYPHQDMLKLMESLSKYAGNSQEKLLKSYGEYLFYRIINTYEKELAGCTGTFSFLLKLNDIIRMEVLKLDPKAKIPLLSTTTKDKETLEVLFSAKPEMGEFIEGILAGCIGYYHEAIVIERGHSQADGSLIKFVLRKKQANE